MPDDYRRVIADYLLRRRAVTRAELERACDLARGDETYMRFVATEFGLDLGPRGACERFQARVAEFCTLSAAERSAEMPEFAGHVEGCEECRRALWEIQPLWSVRARDVAASSAKVLTETIRLLLGRAGELIEQGPGPPGRRVANVAATMGGTAAPDVEALPGTLDASARREWVLRDDEAGWSVHVAVRRPPAAPPQLVCGLTPHDETADPAVDTRMELYKDPDTLVLAGRLGDVAAEPVPLGPGRWTLRLEMPGAPGPRSWDVPLIIVDDPDAER